MKYLYIYIVFYILLIYFHFFREFLEKADIFDKEAIKEERAAHNSRKGFFSDLVLFFS